jgi:hypothetical protein
MLALKDMLALKELLERYACMKSYDRHSGHGQSARRYFQL